MAIQRTAEARGGQVYTPERVFVPEGGPSNAAHTVVEGAAAATRAVAGKNTRKFWLGGAVFTGAIIPVVAGFIVGGKMMAEAGVNVLEKLPGVDISLGGEDGIQADVDANETDANGNFIVVQDTTPVNEEQVGTPNPALGITATQQVGQTATGAFYSLGIDCGYPSSALQDDTAQETWVPVASANPGVLDPSAPFGTGLQIGVDYNCG